MHIITELVAYFEESKYSITEGSHLSSPIRLRLKNRNQSPFNLILRTMTIDSVEDEGLVTFIDSGNISSHSRATTGKLKILMVEAAFSFVVSEFGGFENLSHVTGICIIPVNVY